MTLCIHRIIVLQYFMTQMKETEPNIMSYMLTWQRFLYSNIPCYYSRYSLSVNYRVSSDEDSRPWGTEFENSNPGQQNHITEGSNFFKNIIWRSFERLDRSPSNEPKLKNNSNVIFFLIFNLKFNFTYL